jgi:hypothetical protein
VVLPVADASRAADLCSLAAVDAGCVAVPGVGTVVVPVDAAGARDGAERLSRLLRGAEVVLLQAAEDRVSAQRWHGGTREEDPVAGLLLATWPDDVQRLLLGRLSPGEVSGAASSTGRGRWRALRSLLRSRRG